MSDFYSKPRWYIVQTYSGFENSVKADLERRIESMGQQEYIFEVLIPEENYIDTKKDGSRVEKVRKMYPGYVFVEMIVTDKSWFVVRNTPKVTGFLGSSGGGTKPIPLSVEEINLILKKVGKYSEPVYDFNIGDSVIITNGPFTGKTVTISSINTEKKIVTVLLEVFGRQTPSDFDFTEIEKVTTHVKPAEVESKVEEDVPVEETESIDNQEVTSEYNIVEEES